jgi:xanthine dehydrogenase iron-sulfur cluster and FAD-binding subunit A
MHTRPIRFLHRGQTVEVAGVAPTTSVLDWLRDHARCTGTKEGCNEGDCGACTVVIGELPERTDRPKPSTVRGLSLRSVNACLQFLPTLNGKALFTVEDLKTVAGGALHPVQQAMVECHGSQCGFCTPGIVMSLFADYEQHRAAGTSAGPSADRRWPVGQPVPLHRLPADPRRRGAHVRSSLGATRYRAGDCGTAVSAADRDIQLWRGESP